MTQLHNYPDLTQIDRPVMFWDADTKARMKAWPHGVEWLNSAGMWERIDRPGWYPNSIYRAVPAPAPLTKPTVPWAVTSREWQWAAADADGRVCQYTHEPRDDDTVWQCFDGRFRRIDDLLVGVDPGTCDWRDSKIKRPEGV